ncbi:MAG: energy transducer TonB [Candidatus Koribacter versatilis]|uniref:Energy transducer TonB n=1 Tax=Candidatus Korobacter versatilis TaxID=658062 RepID=A0A932A8I0_9BACT|nr:energy transducer TonB [Candidatus Koribacter versatilis]
MRTARALVLLLLLALSASAQRSDGNVRRIVAGAGAIQANTYVNRSIGVSYEFPAGWRAQTPAMPPKFADRPFPVAILTAQPLVARNVSIALLMMPLDALASVPAEERRDAGKFLERWARASERTEDAHLAIIGAIHPIEVDSHSFVRADVRRSGHAAESYASVFAGPVNGIMFVLELDAPSLAEANGLTDVSDSLTFFPPDDPDDTPQPPLVVHADPSTVKRITISESAARARVRTKVDPQYPAEALERAVEGDVMIDIVVGADGNVAEATVLSGHPLLNDAALDAIKQWTFEPMTVDGAPAETQTKIRVRFSLSTARQSS